MINIQNIDDIECFKWYLVRYLNPADDHPTRIAKVDEDFVTMLNFKDINFPVKIKSYENKEKYPTHVSKKCCEENMLTYYR